MNPPPQPTPEPVKESARWTRRGSKLYDSRSIEVAQFYSVTDASYAEHTHNAAIEALEREVERLKRLLERAEPILLKAGYGIAPSVCHAKSLAAEIAAEIGG